MKIKRALLSVSDKSNILSLAQALKDVGVEIISSGGTAKALAKEGIEVTPIEEVTNNPEAFGGRMKTLSFQVSSALLFRRGHEQDEKQAKELEIAPIDLVVCNLYPFAEVAKSTSVVDETRWGQLIENIDIGGPTMIRAAAKNHDAVCVLSSPSQYEHFVERLQKNELDINYRKNLALSAFAHTAQYDGLISEVLSENVLSSKNTITLNLSEAKSCRYGENSHQSAGVIPSTIDKRRTLANSKALQGKALSYNNYLDADAAWRCNSDLANQFSDKCCVSIIKHANPCGASVAKSNIEAIKKAWDSDPISAFGSIIAFSNEVDEKSAEFLNQYFVEIIMAPSFSNEARELFSKKKNLRLLELDIIENYSEPMLRTIYGGHVVQQEDSVLSQQHEIVVGENKLLSNKGLITFGEIVTKHLKSNAISLVRQSAQTYHLIGAGMGNPNRLISMTQACQKARDNGHLDLDNALLFSDAFFPFRDNIDTLYKEGVRAVVQPGGSIKDKEVIAACQEHGIAMMTIGMRHFRH